MSITASMVKDLREKTSAGMLDCKKALEENQGDFEKAIDWLRAKGLSKAAKKADRAATEGMVSAYIHGEGKIGVLVEINSETDFVARNESFQAFVKDIALHIAAARPLCVTVEEIPADVRDREMKVMIAKAQESGKKADMIDKIVQGQIKKWDAEQALMEQQFIKNPDVKISDYLKSFIATIGENIVIRRFVRYELGEGLAKKVDNFAEEVAAQIKG
jgi:elongation factor Ts